jgi:hypothetical protein
VFSKFPDFDFHDEPELPLPVRLDCPEEKKGTAPDFLLVTIGGKEHEAWVRHRDKTTSRAISIDDSIEVVGSQYKFHIARFVPAGVLTEDYKPADGRGTVSVIRVETRNPDGGREAIWLELNKERFLPTPRGPMALVFHLKSDSSSAHGAHQ